MLRIECQRGVELVDRLAVALLPQERERQVFVRIREVGAQPQRFADRGHAVLDLAPGDEDPALFDPCHGVLGLALQRRVQMRERQIRLSLPGEDARQVAVSRRVAGERPQGGFVLGRGLVQLALLRERAPQVLMRAGIVGRGAQSGQVVGLGLLEVPPFCQERPQVVVRARVLGLEGERSTPEGRFAAVVGVAADRHDSERRGEPDHEPGPAPALQHRGPSQTESQLPQQCEASHDGERERRDERQVHAMLGRDRPRERHEGGGRRKDEEEPGAEETEGRPAPESRERRGAERPEKRRLRQDGVQGPRHPQPVIDRERVRPEGESQVVHDDGELGACVVERRHVLDVEPHGAATLARGDQVGEQPPCGREPCVQPPPPPQCSCQSGVERRSARPCRGRKARGRRSRNRRGQTQWNGRRR